MKDIYVQHCGEDPDEVGGLLYTMPFANGSRLISHVWTNDRSGHRGHGHADQLLSQVTRDADSTGYRLHLQVGDGNVNIDPKRLAGLYKRHGFDWDDALGGQEEGAMTREPIVARTAAAKPPRKPEEVWYDVHKHPAGVPGGMGKSPEHHLRGRGWSGHEINEGSGKKTIQYRNHDHPDFVISYGGGTPQKPDHNFRVLYMGTNTNIPKVTRSYSVAEAMNKVEELHHLHNGLVVQPMIHDSATAPSQQKQPGMVKVPKPAEHRDMTEADAYPQFPSQPEHERTWTNRAPQLKEIPDPPPVRAPKPGPTKYASQGPEGPLQIAFSIFRLANAEDWEGDI